MNIKFLNLASKAIAILLFLTIYSTANSDELYDYIFEQIDTKTLLIDRYDPDYSAYIVNSGNNEVIVYDLQSLEELTNELAKLGTNKKSQRLEYCLVLTQIISLSLLMNMITRQSWEILILKEASQGIQF